MYILDSNLQTKILFSANLKPWAKLQRTNLVRAAFSIIGLKFYIFITISRKQSFTIASPSMHSTFHFRLGSWLPPWACNVDIMVSPCKISQKLKVFVIDIYIISQQRPFTDSQASIFSPSQMWCKCYNICRNSIQEQCGGKIATGQNRRSRHRGYRKTS